jgi:hypothetical protein
MLVSIHSTAHRSVRPRKMPGANASSHTPKRARGLTAEGDVRTPACQRRNADPQAPKHRFASYNAGGLLCTIAPKRASTSSTATVALQRRAEAPRLPSTAPATGRIRAVPPKGNDPLATDRHDRTVKTRCRNTEPLLPRGPSGAEAPNFAQMNQPAPTAPSFAPAIQPTPKRRPSHRRSVPRRTPSVPPAVRPAPSKVDSEEKTQEAPSFPPMVRPAPKHRPSTRPLPVSREPGCSSGTPRGDPMKSPRARDRAAKRRRPGKAAETTPSKDCRNSPSTEWSPKRPLTVANTALALPQCLSETIRKRIANERASTPVQRKTPGGKRTRHRSSRPKPLQTIAGNLWSPGRCPRLQGFTPRKDPLS